MYHKVFIFHVNIQAGTTCAVKNAHILNRLGTVRSQAGAEEKIVKRKAIISKIKQTYFQLFDILFIYLPIKL